MSITETSAAPKPQPHKRANRRKIVAKPKDEEFAGLTAKNCCTACSENRCVISGIGVCAHPLKGGIQASQKGDQKITARFARAKAVLT